MTEKNDEDTPFFLGMFRAVGFAEEDVRKNRVQVGREFINEALMGKVL